MRDCDIEFGDDHDHDDIECARMLDLMSGDDAYDYIRAEQEAQLDAMEAYYGVEPRGWEDTTFPNEY